MYTKQLIYVFQSAQYSYSPPSCGAIVVGVQTYIHHTVAKEVGGCH
jgi:hypothetical protein